MAEFVRVDAHSLAELEAFLSEAAAEPVRLGRVWLAAGVLGAALARVARASAITFGPLVFLSRASSRRLDARPARPTLSALGALLVHECAHVWQYRRDGIGGFLWKYLFFYFTSLYEYHSIAASARRRAYLAIPAEVEAARLEQCWSRGGRQGSAPSEGHHMDRTSIR